ncbi:YHS domain-containing protein [Chitinivibrio alkaliphilus]|uniref:YHS domain-containing protein n=1 Tax=Chitinivibrio alkaliphilus TaxID=1505232 RepID=UPI0004132A46|nr:YHS domain-containing protein [Chitinivibrio alkaliphilus]
MEGQPVDRSIYVDYEGVRVFLCCNSCVTAFEDDPERYLEKMEAEGVAPLSI